MFFFLNFGDEPANKNMFLKRSKRTVFIALKHCFLVMQTLEFFLLNILF